MGELTLRCPNCEASGEDADFTVQVDEPDVVYCTSCNDHISADYIPRLGGGANADNWRRLFAWLKARPVNARKGGA